MTDDNVCDMSFAALRARYVEDACAARAVLHTAFERVASSPAAVWIHVTSLEKAQAALADSTERRRAGEQLSLFGMPFAVKDNIDVAGMPTTAGCPAFSYVPRRSARIVETLLAEGAICIGKTNMDQFATGLTGTRSPYGICASWFDARYIAGGSSSGSAVAVAAGQVAFALGTDSGGSGRIPAAFNNIVGVKPTIGALSLDGMVPNARLFDCPSIFAGTLDDATELRRMLERTNNGNKLARQPVARELSTPVSLKELRVAVLRHEDREFFGCGASQERYEATITNLARDGAKIIETDFAPFRAAGEMVLKSALVAERKAGILDFFNERPDALHPVVRKVFEQANGWSAVDAFDALYRMDGMRSEAEAFWTDADVLVIPSAPRPFLIEEILEEPFSRNVDVGRYSYFVNVLDLCALAIPNGFPANGMPTGITVVGPSWTDDRLAEIGKHIATNAAGLVLEE